VRRRRETNFTMAMCLSLIVHAGMFYAIASSAYEAVATPAVVSRQKAPSSEDLEGLLQKATDDPRLVQPAMEVEPVKLIAIKPPPPPPDEEFGAPNGKGTASHDSPGEKPLQARKAGQDQPLLRQNPGAGHMAPVPPTPPTPATPPQQAPAKSAPASPSPAKPTPAPTPAKPAVAPAPQPPILARKEEPAKKNIDDGPNRTFGVANGDPLVPPRLQAAPKPSQLPAPAPQPKASEAIAEKPTALPLPSTLPALAVKPEVPKSSPNRTDAPIGEKAVALAQPVPADTKVADEIVSPSKGDEIVAPTAAPKPTPPPAQPPQARQQFTLEPDASARPLPSRHSYAPSDADPAPKADTESDAFSTLGSVTFQAGRTDARFGRRVKIKQRPEIDPLNRIDVIAASPTVQLRVDIDETGAVTKVDVYGSSGFPDTIDLPCMKAVYTWWIEPLKDASGKAKRDSILLNISIR